jgi:hypothetical protein
VRERERGREREDQERDGKTASANILPKLVNIAMKI